jgi:glycosyltransferase involved in cell wall biosynthesis
VEHGVTGTLIPVGDPRSLAAALAAYASDPHLRTIHGKSGRQRAQDVFGLTRMAMAHRDLYQAPAGPGGAR